MFMQGCMDFTMMASDMLLCHEPSGLPAMLTRRLPPLLPGVVSLRMSFVSVAQDVFLDFFLWTRDSFAWSPGGVHDLDAAPDCLREVVRTCECHRTVHPTGVVRLSFPVVRHDRVHSVLTFDLASADGEVWCRPLSRLIWAFLRGSGVMCHVRFSDSPNTGSGNLKRHPEHT